MNIKTDGKLLELICMYQQCLFWRGVAHVSLGASMFANNGMLQW